jgi:hypothetical protein
MKEKILSLTMGEIIDIPEPTTHFSKLISFNLKLVNLVSVNNPTH